MRITLISGLTAAVFGLGIFASAGSAYAAGCLQPNQTQYSLADDSDASDSDLAVDAKGFHCDTGDASFTASQVSAYAAAPSQPAPAAPQVPDYSSLVD